MRAALIIVKNQSDSSINIYTSFISSKLCAQDEQEDASYEYLKVWVNKSSLPQQITGFLSVSHLWYFRERRPQSILISNNQPLRVHKTLF